MFAIIVAVSNNFHIMYIKDGKEVYFKCSSYKFLHTRKLIVKERRNE